LTAHVQKATDADISDIAEVWHAGWHEAHAAIVPKALTTQRTKQNFRDRTAHHLPFTRVIRNAERTVAFCMVRDDELYQLYVAPEARGASTATALVADALRRIAATGYATAYLECAIGNARAMRFYEKSGWTNMGKHLSDVDIDGGTFTLEILRFEHPTT
jgi:ribosomal protein S18 acetylase RimI-like enzyme